MVAVASLAVGVTLLRSPTAKATCAEPSVTLSADHTDLDVNAPTARLTATLSGQMCDPHDMLSIYDDLGNRLAILYTGMGLTLSVSVTPGNNQTRTYTAYESQDIPNPGPPSSLISTSNSLTLQNHGWDGTVTLTSSTTQTDANAPTATLTPSLSKPLAGAYYLSIYDDQGNRIADWSAGQNVTPVSVAPGNNQTRTYTAEVSLDIPSPGPPSVDVRSPQSVTIQNVGWDGTVTLTSSTTQTDANAPTATLTPSLSKPLAGAYYLSIYDDQGNRIADWSAGQNVTAVSVTPGNNQVRTYTAEVSLDIPSPGPPSVDVRSPQSVTISDEGWTGSLELSTSVTTVTAGQPSTQLKVSLSKPLAGPYIASVYDDQGNRLTTSYPGQGQTIWLSVTPDRSATVTYSAYVSQDIPNPGPPSNDVRADSSLTYVDGTLGAQRIEGLDTAQITSTHSEEEIELALSAWPLATHAEGGTLSDQALAYSAYIAAGVVAAYALEEVIGNELAHSDLAAWIQGYFDPSEPAPEPTVVPDAPTGVLPPQDLNASRTLEDVVTESILERIANQARSISREEARTIARQCIREVALAGLAPINDKNPCQQLPIYVPGNSAPKTTTHDDEAIAANPAWARLNFVSGQERSLSRGWYTTYEPCIPPYPTDGVQCDEYPFYASAQSGPGASLQLLDSKDNQKAGGLYYAFAYTYCHLESGGPTASPQNPLGDPFLVVPVPAVPTIPDICAA
jgi:hypothetical protein